jgi:hypothetical protein
MLCTIEVSEVERAREILPGIKGKFIDRIAKNLHNERIFW